MALGEGSLQGLASGLLQGYQLYRQGKLDRQAEDDRLYNRDRQEKLDAQNEANTKFSQGLQTSAEKRAQTTYDTTLPGLRAENTPEAIQRKIDKDVAETERTRALSAGTKADTEVKLEELTPENKKLRQKEREGKLSLQQQQIRSAGLSGDLTALNINEKKDQIKRDKEFREQADALTKPYLTALEDSKALLANPEILPAATRGAAVIQKIQSGQSLSGEDNSFLANPKNAELLWTAKYGGSLASKFQGMEVDAALSAELAKSGFNVPVGSKLGASQFQRILVDKKDGTIIPQMIVQFTDPATGKIGTFGTVAPEGDGGFKSTLPVSAVHGEDLEMSLSSMLHMKDLYDKHNIKTPEDVDQLKLASLAALKDGQLTAAELDGVFGTRPEKLDLKQMMDLIGLAKVGGYNDTPEMAQARVKAITAWVTDKYGKDAIPPELVEALKPATKVPAGSAADAAARARAGAQKKLEKEGDSVEIQPGVTVTLEGGG